MQQMLVSQLPLSQRIPALADAIRSIRAHRHQLDREEAEYLEQLRHAEQELKVHPPGSEDTAPSGLLSESSGAEPAKPSEPEHARATATKQATT